MKMLSESARQKLLRHLGAGVLCGITFGQWLRLLALAPTSVDFARLPRALIITALSIKNSFWVRTEQHNYESSFAQARIQPPLFILGHWRSGTTLLHELIAQDKRFSFPNNYQVCFPHTFLSTEARDMPKLARFIPRRRPMDNIEWDMASP